MDPVAIFFNVVVNNSGFFSYFQKHFIFRKQSENMMLRSACKNHIFLKNSLFVSLKHFGVSRVCSVLISNAMRQGSNGQNWFLAV